LEIEAFLACTFPCFLLAVLACFLGVFLEFEAIIAKDNTGKM
jgi:hypothetical protein